MRHHPSCWNKVLAKLGFRRVLRRHQPQAAFSGRLSRIEALESRQMMTAATVNTLADVVDATDVYMSLREAVADSAVNSISFDPSLNGGRIVLTQGELSVNRHMTITGPGADKLAIDAAGASRVMSFWGASNINISGLTITGGNSIGGGGGIYNAANLTLTSVDVSGNVTDTVGGGVALQSGSKLAVYSSTIHDNRAGSGGAGIGGHINAADAVWIVGSTISNNVSPNGAGLSVISTHATPATASVLLSRSTITQNIASNGVGGIGGGVYNVNGATITSHGSIIAGNSAFVTDNSDIYGAFYSASTHNVIGRPGNSGLTSTMGNRAGTNAVPLDPRLSPLDNHGGPTKTHVPLPGSPALDAGGPESIYTPATDQRGFKRLAERPETNVYSPEDIGAVELSSTVGPLGDFNGDGRDDQLLFDPTTRSLNVSVGAAATGNYDVESWGVMPTDVTATSNFFLGDFNGDGRDDLLIRTMANWHLAISDGSTFFERIVALPSPWNALYVGDFDGDGSDEILGGVGSGSSYTWSIANYDDALGFSPEVAATSLAGFSPSFERFFQDVNRDGREDVVTRASAISPWMVRVAGAAADGSTVFAPAADWSSWINYGYSGGVLDGDKALAKLIEEFSWVYNNVELELYPGLMKGVEATRQTKAGNDWDQAALLEARLQALPFMASSDVKIASANVRVNVAELQKWLGVTTPTAVYRAISATMDSNVKAYNSSNGQLTAPTTLAGEATFNSSVATIEFKHAWVRASVPLSSGMQSIDLDPSWKFKERQDGTPLPTAVNLDGGNHATAGQFDEFDFLAVDPRTDHRLPLEFFEDQAMEWLTANQPGKSLADVPRSEVIVTRQFAQLPAGLGTGIVVVDRNSSTTYDVGDIDQYSSLATIADPASSASDALTHRVIITMKSGTTVRWSQELSVPIRSLDSIVISFTSTAQGATNPDANLAYSSTTGPFFSRLIVNGEVLASSGYAFYSSTEKAKIEILHLAPESLTEAVESGTPIAAGPSKNDRLFKYDEKPGQVIAIGLEANQYSRDSIADKQGKLLVASATAHGENELRKHIDDLTALTAAKYWFDFNRQNKTIEGLTQTIGGQQWVGSGLVKGDSVLLVDPDGNASEAGFIRYLPYGMAPIDFGVDLPNINHVTLDTARGILNGEAWQLVGYNSSALEHNIVEEVIGAPSISTIKGLQQAFQRTLGLNANDALIITDYVLEFTSKVVNNARVITHVGNWYSNGMTGVKAASPTNVDITSNIHNYLTSMTEPLGQLRSHIGATTLAADVESLLSVPVTEGDIRILVPFGQTKLNEWVGGVYLVEKSDSMQFMIVADSTANGGYSGGVTLAPPKELQKGNFLNASWAGDPVNVANGNMFRDETDIVYPNPGVPLTFSRHYDSQSLEDFGLGVGWTYSFGDVLYTEAVDGVVNRVWLDSTGRRHYFKPDGAGGYLVPSSLQGQVTFTANQSIGAVDFIFKNSDGLEYHFERVTYNRSTKALVGRLNRILDSNGDGVVVKYETTTNHKLLYVHDVHDGNATPVRRIGFTYGPGGTSYQFDTVTKYDVNGVVQTWDYNYVGVGYVENQGSNKRLSSVELPAVTAVDNSGIESSLRPKVEYISRDVIWDSAMGMIEKIIETDGSWHTYEYFKNGRVFRVKQGECGVAVDDPNVDVQTFDYNIYKNQTEFIDERGNSDIYVHQKNGLLEKQIHADRSQIRSEWGTIGEADEYLMTATRDERGAIENFSYYGTADPAFKRGLLKEATAKHFLSQTDALVTKYDYEQPDVTGKPHLVLPSTVVVDPDAGSYVGKKLTTTRQYHPSGDAKGNLWKIIDSENNVVEYSYYPNSDVVTPGNGTYRRGLLKSIKQPAIVDAAGNPIQYETVFDYDAAGNVIKSKTQTVVIAPAVPVVISESTFVYDSTGNVVQQIVGANVVAERVVTESVYDALGRLRETGFADANAAIDPIDGFTSRFKYDAMGRVRESKDPLGRVTRFEYDRQGSVVKQINPDGTELLHEYDALGNCIATTDALDRTTRFVYDSRNRVVQIIHPDGAIERLRYDGAGNVVASIDALGNATTVKFDAVGRLVETNLPDPINPFGTAGPTTTNKYDKLGNLIETIDPEANVTQFKYDKLGRVVQTQTLKGNSIRTNPAMTSVTTLLSLTTIDYDAVGNVIESASYDVTQYDAAATATLLANPRAHQTPADITAKKVHVVSMRYDAFGRLVKTINADDTTTSTTYDAAGRVKVQKDELTRVTLFEYDQFGRLTKTTSPDPDGSGTAYASPVTSYRYDAVGNRIATIDPRGFTTRFEYDAFNRLIATVDAQGNRTRSVYDVAGQMVAAVDALGRASYTLYDERGRASEQRGSDPDGSGAGVAPVTRHHYDDAGRVVETIDSLGYAKTYQYDNLGRVIKESFTTGYQVIDSTDSSAFQLIQGTVATQNSSSDYGGSSKIITPTSVNAVARWNFTGVEPGDYRILVHWSGFATTATGFTYRLSDWYNGGPTDFFPADVDTQWVGRGQLTGSSGDLRFENGAWNDWYQLPIGFQVSAVSPKLSVHLAATGTFQADAVRIERIASRSYTYDANGNLLTETDPRGNQTVYTYDELDRVATETLPDPDGPDPGTLLSPQTTTTYDGYSNVKRVTERRGTGNNSRSTDYSYDLRNRRTEEIFDVNTGGGATYLNRKTTYAYDDVGNLTTKIELPGHATLERRTSYAYDGLNRLWIQADNDFGSIVAADPRERTAIHSYDAAGNVTQTLINQIGGIDPRQIATLYRYDALGQLLEQTDQGFVGGVTEKRTTRFQYDAVGQQITTIDPLLRVSRSDFDRLGRLIKSTDPDPDGAGLLQPHVTTFVYDAAGQLILKNNGGNETAGAHETDRYAYDPQGRLIRSTNGRDDATTRQYDAAGNLTKLIDAANNVTTYAYDGLDRIITETTSSGAREFKFDNNGNIYRSIDRNGKAIAYSYTRDDQAAFEKWFDAYADLAANVNDKGSVERYYDNLGRLSEEQMFRRNASGGIDYRATDSYLYDGLDRIVVHTNQSLINPAGRSSTGVPALKQTYAYAYDASGLTVDREQFVAGAFAASTKSTYNAFGELVRQEDKDVSAASGASAILDFESTDAAFAYLADGSLASTTRYTDWDAALSGHRNRVQTSYAYDGAGRINNIAHSQARRTTATWPGDTSLLTFGYGYDAAGRINLTAANWNQLVTGLSTRTDETQHFTFDGAGQLTGVDSNLTGGDANYNYGANGNRTTSNEPVGGSDVYTTGTENRVSQDSTYTYEYDAEGNLIYSYETSHPGYRTYYTWDHRNRLAKVSEWHDTHEVLIIDYRYNAANALIYRKIDKPFVFENGPEFEHYLVEGGQRTMAFEQDGDVKRRYSYGPTGEVLFDEVFDATVTTPSQSEVDLLLPLGDHQHSTRVVLAHDANDATYVRQSLDYAQFGRVTATLGAGGLADSTGVVTAFAHHGSLLDAATGLQKKGERWYSPDLGRFVSEDPIQDGANWFMFAGNDPVNYADPSGLSMQGHPLGGGYSGNVTRQPTIPSGNLFGGTPLSSSLNNFLKGAVNQALNPVRLASTTFGGFVDATAGNAILSGGFGPASTSVGSIASYQALAGPAVSRQPTRVASATSNRALSQTLESPTAAFFGSLWGDAKNLGATLWEGSVALATDADARSAFSQAWQTERVQPLGDRLYNVSKGYGHSDKEIGDQNSFALARATVGEILPINVTAQALEGRDIGTGQRTSDLQRSQDSINAASGWILFGAGAYNTGQQIRGSLRVTPKSLQEQPYQQQQGNGYYTNKHQSGKTYSGKGDEARMSKSAAKIAKTHGDPVTEQTHTPAANTRESFIGEQNSIEANGGPGGNTYNKINSPGKKLRDR